MPFPDFVLRHPRLFIGAWLGLAIAQLCWGVYRNRKLGRVFPSLKSVNVRFHEDFASGSSHRDFFTRLSGASRCLRVTVTDSEVWVRTFFPITVVAMYSDLRHRVPRESVTLVETQQSRRGKRLVIELPVPGGGRRRLGLLLRDPEGFLSALKGPPPLPVRGPA